MTTPTLPPLPSTIANLPLASTPLAGNEMVPISQGGVTKAVAANGFTITGPTGATGPQGPPGATGATGPAGGAANINAGTINQIAYYNTTTTLSGTNAIPNGTTATTQSSNDNSTKVATTAYVDTRSVGSPNSAGRLTLTTATPVLISTVSAATTIYFTPYLGNQVPIYGGATFAMTTFTELSQALTDTTKSPAAAAASKLYDMFVWNDSGTLRCTRGPAWSNATTRGTGAGTTQISVVLGYYTNTVAITNGPGAGLGTYVGTIATNAGSTVDFILGGVANGGTAGSIGLWNYFNRIRYNAQVEDNTATWTNSAGTWGSANASTSNRVTYVSGIAEDLVEAMYAVEGITSGGGTGFYIGSGIAQDSTSAIISTGGYEYTTSSTEINATAISFAAVNSGLGQHYLQAMERSNGCTFRGINGASLQDMNFMVWGRY